MHIGVLLEQQHAKNTHIYIYIYIYIGSSYLVQIDLLSDPALAIYVDIFLRITQYIGDAHNARTLIPMNIRTQTLPLGASSKTVPANPQD
jgi:hypothetical protein